MNPLTGRGFQKHPPTFKKFLPEKHYIQIRYIYQDIGNGHMTNTNKILVWWEGKKQTALTLLADRDQSLFSNGWSSTTLLAFLVPGCFISVHFNFTLLPCTHILVLYLPIRTIQVSFQAYVP